MVNWQKTDERVKARLAKQYKAEIEDRKMTTKPTKIEELIAAELGASTGQASETALVLHLRGGTSPEEADRLAQVLANKGFYITSEARTEIKEMYEENKRLREKVKAQQESYDHSLELVSKWSERASIQQDRNIELKAQIEKLREALIDIKTCGSGTIARKIAIQTLAETKEDE